MEEFCCTDENESRLEGDDDNDENEYALNADDKITIRERCLETFNSGHAGVSFLIPQQLFLLYQNFRL